MTPVGSTGATNFGELIKDYSYRIMHKLTQLWNELRSSLWFVPGLIVLSSIAVAFALIEVDSASAAKC